MQHDPDDTRHEGMGHRRWIGRQSLHDVVGLFRPSAAGRALDSACARRPALVRTPSTALTRRCGSWKQSSQRFGQHRNAQEGKRGQTQ
jgi:hypothetical protein